MKRLALGCASAALAGCAGPMMVGQPGQLRAQGAITAVQPSRGEPTFCIASSEGPAREGIFATLAQGSKFRDLRMLTQQRPDPTGCDVLLKLTSTGLTVFSQDGIEAYSAYTQELLWQGSTAGRLGKPGMMFLAPVLQRDFQPGQPAFQKLEETKARGRRLTVEALEDFAGSGLLAEQEAYQGLYSYVRLGGPRRVQQAEAAPRASAAAAAASEPRPRSDVDDVPPARAARPKAYAVVIGVAKYRRKLPAADFADDDARLVARYLRSAWGYQDANVAELINDEASKGDFEKYFEKWLPNHVEPGSEVFVYYSGHGAPNPKTGDAYLVPFDADPTYIDETGYSVKRMYERLGRLPAAKVAVVMDSCFSGAGGRSVIAAGARPLVTLAQADVPAKITALSASAADQISNSYQAQGHGLFTYYFLKGIKQKGDDLRGVFDYLKPEVSGYARRELNADQEPQWRGAK